jgi:hypothetical protein
MASIGVVNNTRLLVCKPTNFVVAPTSLVAELVGATIKYGMAPLEVVPEFAPNF